MLPAKQNRDLFGSRFRDWRMLRFDLSFIAPEMLARPTDPLPATMGRDR
jgi:hypothetical protein